ncbi:hypothetical protein EX30DRAFT_339943 [Ascodesmis nigricans]|uniref:DNA mismatch repair protein HSM3 N-terminal domain-containing protein n=1 Tax=Ascodesmis nigricans TaxID=341454 RepID=A0A4S2MZA0_9PEZI|nr:hypothetical protein EX30DRAFT_339943 [Ascodesmis nigricans]
MDPPPSLDAFTSHINALLAPSPPPLDITLLETFTAGLTATNAPPLVPSLLPLLTSVLHTPIDPAPVTRVLSRLLSPISFFDLNATSETLLSTLQSPSPAVQLLGLSIISKAAASPDEASVFTTKFPDLVDVLLSLSLDATSATAVAEAAKNTIVALTDKCGYFGQLVFYEFRGGEREKIEEKWIKNSSVSHGRLLSLLQDMAILNFPLVDESGILNLVMKPREDGDIMLTLLQWELATNIIANTSKTSGAVDWAEESGLTKRAYDFLTSDMNSTEDNHDVLRTFHFGKITDYLATLISRYPDSLTPERLDTILASIQHHLSSPSKDPHQPTLHLLTSLPTSKIPPLLISAIPLQADFLPVIAGLVKRGGPRILDTYLTSYPTFWERLVSYGKMQGAKETALPALDVVEATAALVPVAPEENANGTAEKDNEERLRKVLEAPGVLNWLLEDTAAGLGEWEVVQRRRDVVSKLAEKTLGSDVGVALKEALRRGGIGEPRPEVATVEL